MTKKNKIILIIALFSLPLFGISIYAGMKYRQENSSDEKHSYKTIYWNKLRELDLESGNMPDELKALNGTRIRVPGFVVPLEDEDTQLSEFLLVPSPQACIHVPPPPPNQMVMVRMKKGSAPKREWGPIWLNGLLEIKTTNSSFGNVSYQMVGETTEKFEY